MVTPYIRKEGKELTPLTRNEARNADRNPAAMRIAEALQAQIAAKHGVDTPSCETREALLRLQAQDYNAGRGSLDDGYDCPLCLNRGMIALDDGSMRLCTCKDVRDSYRRLRKLGLFSAAQRLTFDRYRAQAPWQRQLLEQTQAFVQQERPGWLFIGGQSGCGKTHLCTAAAVTLMQRGHALRYMRWMNDSARLKTLALDAARGEMMDMLIQAPLLYIDDLFKSAPTDADRHIAFELLDARYCDDSRITILSSERTQPELEAIDEAIAGRIAERCGAFALNVPRDPQRNYRLR